jgi:hypothetical protein
MKRFMLVLLGGVIAGAVAGFLFGTGGGGPTERLRRLMTTARRAVDEGRQRMRHAPAPPAAAGALAPTPSAEAKRLPLLSGAQETVRSWWQALRARWREAVAEGRQAAAERQRDLRRRYERLTGRA